MTRPAAPGPRLGVGRIRVDAARAIAKLREYQLVERAAWVLEGIRAAVASSATDITLDGDSNDIWLSWNGEPWTTEDLTRLFDELVSPEAASERHHLRLLAAAVNSGLGLAPAYVDVIAVHDDHAIRARYSPDVLDDPGADTTESALRKLTTENIPVPDGARRGMRVHLRRRASLEVLSYLFGEPPELEIARRASADVPTLLTIGKDRFHRTEHSHDVVRVPLGDGLDGFLAIADPETATGSLVEIAERGVVLARYPLELPMQSDAPMEALTSALPIRLFVDAPRMPTNASRSQVQRASHPIAAAENRVEGLMPKLVDALVKRLASEHPRRDRIAAFTLLAGFHDRPWYPMPTFPAWLAPLATLPLVRDASGAPRPVQSRWSGLVYRERKPLDADLEPWVNDILWVPPGDPAERLVAGAFDDRRELRRRLRAARQQRRDHEKFFAHDPRPPTVIAKTLPLHRMRLGAELPESCVPQSVFDGLAGEVCLHADDGPSELVVLHHGREIERVSHASPVRFEVVIDTPTVTPAARFRGVVRNVELARVERAMRAGVLRAIEAICADERSAERTQVGLMLARSMGAAISAPLVNAPAWRSVDGGYLSHATVAGLRAIGIVEPGIDVAPTRLPMIRCDQPERVRLSVLAPGVEQIPYGQATARPATAAAIASKLAQSNTFALAITEETRVGAIAAAGPTQGATISLHHRGVQLSTLPYRDALIPCQIVVDSDTIIPGPQWETILDKGSTGGNYRAWELQFICATARALVGDRSLDIYGPWDIDVHGPLGRMLCGVFAQPGARELLGSKLFEELRAQRIWTVLGDPIPQSVDQLCARYAAMIPYVGHGAVPVAGFTPLVADDLTASAVATLAGLPVREASLELETRRHADVREKRLAKHRELPVQPRTVPGESVPIAGPIVRGVVGVGSLGLEIQVLVEGRPFAMIRRSGLLPLRAAVEIDAVCTMPAFDGIPDDVTQEIIARVTLAAPELLRALAVARPHALGDRGPARTLLAQCAREELPPTLAQTLLAAPIFPTVQGDRTSIAAARRPNIATTTWPGTWLALENEPPHRCDAPVILISDITGEIPTILRALHGPDIEDITDEIVKLQGRLRMERGLAPKPTVPNVAPELKRSLGELGERALGPGEIALVDDESSTALLHIGGELRKVVPIDVWPAVRIAIEAPDLIQKIDQHVSLSSVADQLRALKLDGFVDETSIPRAQELAIQLAHEVLAHVSIDALGPLIRRNLTRAMFRGVLEPSALAHVPVFETTVPSWVTPPVLDQQLALFGNVWAVRSSAGLQPLDDRRLVLHMDADTVALALARGVMIVDATQELVLDAQARNNRDKPLATSLALPDASQLLAQVALPGDGITAPRGMVGVLHPSASHLRGLHAHREMHPFTRIPDASTWPIVAMIDDARFEPDRTWSRPDDDSVWRAALTAVREASKRAFVELATPPADALAALPLGDGSVFENRFEQLRGALWIAGPPLTSPPLRVIGPAGARNWTPRGETGVTGVIYTQSDDERLAPMLEDLCALAYGRLVRKMPSDSDHPDVVAHVAHALALGRIFAQDAVHVAFPCFNPSPLTAAALASLLADSRPVNAVPAHDDHVGLIIDSSVLSRVVVHHLRGRLRRPSARIPTSVPAPPHPLQHVLDAIRARFAQLGLEARARFVERSQPMFAYDEGLVVASTHPRLIKLGAALLARSPWAHAALDAVVAHGATVLNVALAEITDAAEMHAIGALLETA